MTRKDSTEMDRAHYYSQFWIDVAQGKRDVISGRGADQEPESDELLDDDLDAEFEAVLKPIAKPKPAKGSERKSDQSRPTLSSLAELELLMKNSAEMEGGGVRDLDSADIDDLSSFSQPLVADTAAIEMDFDPTTLETEEPAEAEDVFAVDEFEDEDTDEWGNARKPTKQPKGRKREPRERRGNF